MEDKYSVALCRLVFLCSAINPYVISILFRTDYSVHSIVVMMSARSFLGSCSVDFSLCFLSLLLKHCLFPGRFFYSAVSTWFLILLILFFSCMNISPCLFLFLPEALAVLLTLFFLLQRFLFCRFWFCWFVSYFCAVVVVAVSYCL